MRKISFKYLIIPAFLVLGLVLLVYKKPSNFSEDNTLDILINLETEAEIRCVKLVNPSKVFKSKGRKILINKGQNKDLICWVEEAGSKNLIVSSFNVSNLENENTLSPVISFKEVNNILKISNKINDFYMIEGLNTGTLTLKEIMGTWQFDNLNLPEEFNKLCSNCFSKLKTGVPLKLLLASVKGQQSFPITSLWYEPKRFSDCGEVIGPLDKIIGSSSSLFGEFNFTVNPDTQEQYLENQNFVALEDLEDCSFVDSWRCNLINGKVKISLKKGEYCSKASSKEIKTWCQMRGFNDFISKSKGCYLPYFLDLKKYNNSDNPINYTKHQIIQGLGWNQRSVITSSGAIGGTFSEEGNLPVLKEGKIVPCQSKMVSAFAFKYINDQESIVFIYRQHFQPEGQDCDFNKSVAPNNFTFVRARKID